MLKLADFGFSKVFQGGATHTYTFCGPSPGYLAPEVLLDDSKHGKAVDWWTLGILCYDLLTGGSEPFSPKDRNPATTGDNIRNCHRVYHRRPEWRALTPETHRTSSIDS